MKTDSVCLSWGVPEGLTRPPEFTVTWRSEVDSGTLQLPGQVVDIQNLTPGEMYTFSVATLYDGSQSPCVSATVRTGVDPLNSESAIALQSHESFYDTL